MTKRDMRELKHNTNLNLVNFDLNEKMIKIRKLIK